MSAKHRFPNDPYASRETEKYAVPLPSREYIMQVLGEQGVPMDLDQLNEYFGLAEGEEKEFFSFRLRAMERDGQVVRNRRGGYGLVTKMDLVRGRVIAHPDGFGFLVPDVGAEDVFLAPKQMRSLLHGDRAVVRLVGVDHRGRREGALVEVLDRANHKMVGRFVTEHGLGFVIPSNKRIHQDIAVPPEHQGNARDGQMVVVHIVEQPSWRSQPIGKIVEVLGDHLAPGMEIDVAIHNFEIPMEWPQAVVDACAQIKPQVSAAECEGRVDLRNVPLVTIDGEDAKDFDDAVYCERHGKGWRLLVAIADVSHYVSPGSPLDDEASNRGNSVYFPGRVIPMLPEILSNELCSLNPQVDRLCMVCELFVTAAGKVRDYRFMEAVMHSHARLTYTEVADILVNPRARGRKQYAALVPHLEELYALYQALRSQREKRGAIDFETTETRILFGENKKIQAIVPVERNDAHRIIEECMVTANVAAAQFTLAHEVPSLYRVHAGPTLEKFTALREFLAELGLSVGARTDPQPRHYAKLIDSIKGRPDMHLIQTVLLRSLSQAVYSPENCGHFGLSFEAYTHFTSPIRRYPDLLVHRAIRHILRGADASSFSYSHEDMVALGDHSSMTERRADEATRDATDWLKCEYMQDKVGEEFTGVITSVTAFGMFVQLHNVYVEGLVHVSGLQNDYYHHDPAKHRLVGERTRKVYRLADVVKIKVMRVSLDDRKIDFEIVEPKTARPPRTATTDAKDGTGPRRRKHGKRQGKKRRKKN